MLHEAFGLVDTIKIEAKKARELAELQIKLHEGIIMMLTEEEKDIVKCYIGFGVNRTVASLSSSPAPEPVTVEELAYQIDLVLASKIRQVIIMELAAHLLTKFKIERREP